MTLSDSELYTQLFKRLANLDQAVENWRFEVQVGENDIVHGITHRQ